jgi:enoyl-CoA hydratase
MSAYTALKLFRDEHVAELRLDRPELLNRFDATLFRELGPALQELADDSKIRAVVFTSTGACFSAGGDFDAMLGANESHDVLMWQVDEGRRLFRSFADLAKPLVVALHGDVFGVGTSIVLTADAVVTSPTVSLSDPHVRMGLVAGDGGCVAWPVNLPFIRAKRQLLWGDPISGQDAFAMGIVTDLVPSAGEVRDRAFELAVQVAELPPVAVQLTKRALNKYLHARVDDVLDVGFYLEAISARTDDLREAVAAFKEKRAGNWSGS